MTVSTITILGDGQMSLACAAILLETRPDLRLTIWGHDETEIAPLRQSRRSDRLPGVTLPPSVVVTSDLAESLGSPDLVISAIPVQFTRRVWQRASRECPAFLKTRAPLVSVAKGIENETLLRPSQIMLDALGELSSQRRSGGGIRPTCALSGPTIAPELARRLPASMVAASEDRALAQLVQQLFTTKWLRIYTSDDIVGVELAGALKNVIAIAAGIIDGLELGFNAKSALLARGLAEIARLGEALGARTETFFGLAGVGDLATTCFCPEGRNRSCGEALGRGQKLDDYLAHTKSVVEGVATAKSVKLLAAQKHVEMPIAEAVHAVLYDHVAPKDAIRMLMSRELKPEKVG